MAYYYDNSGGQYFFDRAISFIVVAVKWIFKSIIYYPLLLTGYILTSGILSKEDDKLAWVGLIVLFAFSLYLLIYFIKGMLLAFKSQGNLLWFPLLLLCIAFTCILPVWVIYEPLENLMFKLSKNAGEVLTIIVSVAFGIYLYSRYHFLTNIAPTFAYPVYQFGINLGFSLLRIAPAIKAVRSRQLI